MKYLKDLKTNLENDIKEFKKVFEKIDEKKENLKKDIQQIFRKIRNSFNNREDELLINIDKAFDKIFFKGKTMKDIEKLSNDVKILLEKGKIKENEWKDKKKLSLLINNCIVIEKHIQNIKKIMESIKSYNSLKKFDFKFITGVKKPRLTEEEENLFINVIRDLFFDKNEVFKEQVEKEKKSKEEEIAPKKPEEKKPEEINNENIKLDFILKGIQTFGTIFYYEDEKEIKLI